MWLLWFAACQYTPPGSPVDDLADAGASEDDASTQLPVGGCAETALCLGFEEAIDLQAMDIARDGSGHERDAIATDVVGARRVLDPPVVDSRAAGFRVTSSLEVADDLGVDRDFTVEMWIQPTIDLTGSARQWLIDSNHRFYMSFGGNRTIRCGINLGDSNEANLRLDSTATLDDSLWHHVACTFDASTTTMKVYVDGQSSVCRRLGTPIVRAPGGTTLGAPHSGGLSFEHLVGSLDSVRVFARALSTHEVCTLAGRTTCGSICNVFDD